MKRIFLITGSLVLVLAAALFLFSINRSPYQDGIYSAQAAEFANSGWKETVQVTIEDGKIAKINWDAIYKDDSIPIRKKQYSKSGLYGMLAAGASNEWYDQALAAEQFVLRNGIDALQVGDEGGTDAVTGCTIHVNEFQQLVYECLEQAKRQ
ncbi:MAG: FMN-binding protein [Clostridiales bacterium]